MKLAFLAALLVAAAPTGAPAAEGDYLARFAGPWSGGGTVQRNIESGPTRVNCSMRGENSETRVVIAGECRAYLVFSRMISADLTFDTASGRYSGVYTGSTIGPAALHGERRGDVVDLVVTWPREVNGSIHSRMTIRNSGNGGLQIQVLSRPGGTGEEVVVTDMTLARAQ